MNFINFMFENPMIIIVGGALLLFEVIRIVFDREKSNDIKYQNELAVYEEELENSIQQKEKQIEELELEIYKLKDIVITEKMASHGQLTPTQNKALDMFESQSIRISADIIEELIYSKINELDACIDFINAQRMQWKLENTKKLYRGK